MKKIIFLFIGAILSFWVLAHLDEYESLILPLIGKAEAPNVKSFDSINNSVLKIITDFNTVLTSAYLTSDPSLLVSGPIEGRLRSSIAEEINYLKREGKIMDYKVKDIDIKKIERISPYLISVTTVERIGIEYSGFTKDSETVKYPDAIYEMTYSLTGVTNNWKVMDYETRSVK